jgi:hypothetical protein
MFLKPFFCSDYCATDELKRAVQETECELTDSEQLNQGPILRNSIFGPKTF